MSKAMDSWWYETATDAEGEIWCYTDQLSYLPGDEVSLRVHTSAARYSLAIVRDGAIPDVVLERQNLKGSTQDTPPDCSERGCGWSESFTFTVPATWRSGGYIAYLTTEGTRRSSRYEHWFAIRPSRPDPGTVLLLATTSTWLAYNAWGGSNSYEGIHGPGRNAPAARLSIERPWGRGLAWLPPGAARHPYETDVPPGGAVRYGAKEAAYATGLPKYTASAGWAMFETHFVRWAETRGYRIHVATQHDLHRDPNLLDGYRCLAIVGHDEYWSWEMRDHLDAYLDNGGTVARLAGNFLWQVRLEDHGRQQVCHKWAAEDTDPVLAQREQSSRLTSCWDHPAIGRPAAQTMGLTASRGGYVRCYGVAVRACGGYTVYRPRHWALDGADLYYGDTLGASARVFAHEVDGLAYTMRGGLPYATGEDGIDPDAAEILAMNPASYLEEDHGNYGTTLHIGAEDAEFFAGTLHGAATPDTVEQVRHGAGMLAAYARGKGGVVNAGSDEWVNGLRLREPFIERITDNILRSLLDHGWPSPGGRR